VTNSILQASSFTVVPLNSAISEIKLGKFYSMIYCFYLDTFTGLSGAHQYQNASLAIRLARTVLRDDTQIDDILSEPFIAGLKNSKWPGRCQAVSDPSLPRTTWYLDGAHTPESMQCCLQWFVAPDVGLFREGEK
jgi:folylpolyglutamate synthase